MHFDTGDVVQLGRGNFVDPREFDARRLAGGVVAILIVTGLGLLPPEVKVLEFLGKPTLSWPIGAATVVILGTAGLLAGYFPARRAAAIDPAATLRYE